MALSKQEIFAACDRPTKTVNIPEWNGDVIIRTLTAREREEWEQSALDSKNKTAGIVRASLAVACCIDVSGQPIFTPDDIPALADKSAKALDRIFEAAGSLNGLGAKDVEALAKN